MRAVITADSAANLVLRLDTDNEAERALLSVFLAPGKDLAIMSTSHACDMHPSLYQCHIGWRAKDKEAGK